MAGSGVYAEITEGDVFKYYSDGEWKKSSSGKSVSIINPTTRKTQYKVQGIHIVYLCICMRLSVFLFFLFLNMHEFLKNTLSFRWVLS